MATKKSPHVPKESVQKTPVIFTAVETFKIILQTVAIFIGGQVIGSLIVTFFGMGAGADSKQIVSALNDNNLVRFLLILLIELATFWLITLFLKRQGLRLSDIGVQKKILLRYAKTAVVGYVFYFALFLAVISKSRRTRPYFGVSVSCSIATSCRRIIVSRLSVPLAQKAYECCCCKRDREHIVRHSTP